MSGSSPSRKRFSSEADPLVCSRRPGRLARVVSRLCAQAEEAGQGPAADQGVRLTAMSPKRGKLRVYLGYAAGVGKTYQMLEDAQRLRASGVDVVIGYFEPHGRKDTIQKTEGLEIIPRQEIVYRGKTFEEMDTHAIIDRHPAVCAVDEFAHT